MSTMSMSQRNLMVSQQPSVPDYLSDSGGNYGVSGNSLDFLVDASKMFDQRTPQRKISRETILSGQFMISELDEESGALGAAVGQDSEQPKSLSPVHTPEIAVELDKEADSEQKYTYGPPSSSRMVTIDASLTKLFQCMTLAYSGGTLTSPKWKTFKGLRLKLKDKIRLNNIIWRAWHIQYIKRGNPNVCRFAITADMHNRPEAQVLEGKYWKRRAETVKAEYQKWRLYYKEQLTKPLNKVRSLSTKKTSVYARTVCVCSRFKMQWISRTFFSARTRCQHSTTILLWISLIRKFFSSIYHF